MEMISSRLVAGSGSSRGMAQAAPQKDDSNVDEALARACSALFAAAVDDECPVATVVGRAPSRPADIAESPLRPS
jgi:hypothetical protein